MQRSRLTSKCSRSSTCDPLFDAHRGARGFLLVNFLVVAFPFRPKPLHGPDLSSAAVLPCGKQLSRVSRGHVAILSEAAAGGVEAANARIATSSSRLGASRRTSERRGQWRLPSGDVWSSPPDGLHEYCKEAFGIKAAALAGLLVFWLFSCVWGGVVFAQD